MENMKISLLGTGDLSKISRYTSMPESELAVLIEQISKLLAKSKHELVIIPNKGIPLEIAKIYKQEGGKKVMGVVPIRDKDYGLGHIEEFLSLIDERIEVDSWYDADGKVAALGDICLVTGLSAGVMRALTALKFHQKYRNNKTKLIVFKNTISAKIQKEIEEEIPIIYINSIEELKKII
jgi:hypothetical protein